MKSLSSSQFLKSLAAPQRLQTPVLIGPLASLISQWWACGWGFLLSILVLVSGVRGVGRSIAINQYGLRRTFGPLHLRPLTEKCDLDHASDRLYARLVTI